MADEKYRAPRMMEVTELLFGIECDIQLTEGEALTIFHSVKKALEGRMISLRKSIRRSAAKATRRKGR